MFIIDPASNELHANGHPLNNLAGNADHVSEPFMLSRVKGLSVHVVASALDAADATVKLQVSNAPPTLAKWVNKTDGSVTLNPTAQAFSGEIHFDDGKIQEAWGRLVYTKNSVTAAGSKIDAWICGKY